jgi:ATP-dependent helicase Lhr and Lhr-like helicase
MSRWCGGSRSLHFDHARAMRHVLATGELAGVPTQRAIAALDGLRAEMSWVDETGTAIVAGPRGDRRWWTFAGLRANAALASALGDLVESPQIRDSLAIPLVARADAATVKGRLAAGHGTKAVDAVSAQAIQELKFERCLPRELAEAMLAGRARDGAATAVVLAETIREVIVAG